MNTIISESDGINDIPIDVYQKLANDRILFIYDTITDRAATNIVATLLLKDQEDSSKKITLFINSAGGSIRNALMIYDMMNLIESPIETICVGEASDEAIIILSSGTQGHRFATKNSIISISQLYHQSVMPSDMSSAKKHLDLSIEDNRRMMNIIMKTTNKDIKQIMNDTDRRLFMNSRQAVKYNIIDKVI